MNAWEYRVIDIVLREGTQFGDAAEPLNLQGKERWELITVLPFNYSLDAKQRILSAKSDTYLAFFKRPIKSPSRRDR